MGHKVVITKAKDRALREQAPKKPKRKATRRPKKKATEDHGGMPGSQS